MYFSKNNNFIHGVMFHHFHDDKKHFKSQGSIDKNLFYKIIKHVGRENIVDPKEFSSLVKNKQYDKNKICITFDDALKSQIDIAIPVLEELKIKAFFFIYSDVFNFNKNNIEIIRYFRNIFFDNINIFYNEFANESYNDFKKSEIDNFFNNNLLQMNIFQKHFPIYSKEDTKYRFLRDRFFTHSQYLKIIERMYKKFDFNIKETYFNTLMKKEDIVDLSMKGHEIGLHSHTHPTKFENLIFMDQEKEYKTNLKILKKILDNKNINSMSHPCGSYNDDTLKILNKLDISIGFKESLLIDNKMQVVNNSNLEIARIDHSNIVKKLNL